MELSEIELELKGRNFDVRRNIDNITVKASLLSKIKIYKLGEEIVVEPRFGLYKMTTTLITNSAIEAIIVAIAIASYPRDQSRSTAIIALIVAAIMFDIYRYTKVKALQREISSVINKLKYAT